MTPGKLSISETVSHNTELEPSMEDTDIDKYRRREGVKGFDSGIL